MDNPKIMDDTEIRIKGIDALHKSLGAAGAFRFLSLLYHEATDYVEIFQSLYQEQTVDQIFERARQNWHG